MIDAGNYALWKAEHEFEKIWDESEECDYCCGEGCDRCDEELMRYYDSMMERMK